MIGQCKGFSTLHFYDAYLMELSDWPMHTYFWPAAKKRRLGPYRKGKKVVGGTKYDQIPTHDFRGPPPFFRRGQFRWRHHHRPMLITQA